MLSRSQSAFEMVRALRIIFNVFLTENGALPIRVVRDDGERPEVEFIQLLDACQLLAAGDLPGCIKQLLLNRFTPMVFRQLHYCKVANSPSDVVSDCPYNCLPTACRSLLSLTIASRDRICRSFTIVQALLYSLFL